MSRFRKNQMAASAGNFSHNKGARLGWLGALVLVAALAGWWLARGDGGRTSTGEDAAIHPAARAPVLRPPAAFPVGKRVVRIDFPRPSFSELAERHEIEPDAAEWKMLLALLQQPLPESPSEEDRDIIDAVKARFAAHAGAEQIDGLASIFQYSSSMEIGQNALEVLGVLQSENFQQRAREIMADASLPADDQVVTALAKSLVREGTPGDLVLVLDRMDNGKAGDPTEYNGMDGLMSAVHGALAVEMEPVLCEALSSHTTRGWTSRLAAAAALRNHATSASTRTLSQAARDDPDSRVAAEAAASLADLRTPEE